MWPIKWQMKLIYRAPDRWLSFIGHSGLYGCRSMHHAEGLRPHQYGPFLWPGTIFSKRPHCAGAHTAGSLQPPPFPIILWTPGPLTPFQSHRKHTTLVSHLARETVYNVSWEEIPLQNRAMNLDFSRAIWKLFALTVVIRNKVTFVNAGHESLETAELLSFLLWPQNWLQLFTFKVSVSVMQKGYMGKKYLACLSH